MSRKARMSLGIVAVAAVGAALLPAATASAVVSPTITATPSTSLFNTETVQVSATGLPPSTALDIAECQLTVAAANPSDPTQGCDLAHAIVGTVSSDGTGILTDTPLVISTGQLGADPASVCDFSTNGDCGIVVTGTDLTLYGVAPVSFSQVVATPNSDLKNGQTVSVSGDGLPANSNFVLSECNAADAAAIPNASDACDLNNLGVVQTDGTGHFPATDFTVTTGQQGVDANSICDSTTNGACAIAVADLISQTPYGGATITFAPPVTVVKKAVTVTAAATDNTVRPGQKFVIKGRTLTGTKGVNKLKVTLYKRAKTGATWTKVSGSTKTTSTIGGKAGSYRYSLKGLKHNEQYQVRHPNQRISNTVYKADSSPIVKIKRV